MSGMKSDRQPPVLTTDPLLKPRWKTPVILAIILGSLMGFASWKSAREKREILGELQLKNLAEVPVSVRYRGRYGTARFAIAPSATRSITFRPGDVLILEATNQGVGLTNQFPLLGDSSFSKTTGRHVGEIQIIHFIKGRIEDLSGSG